MISASVFDRKSYPVFGAAVACVLLAFWPSDFSALLSQQTYQALAHGIAIVLWCASLITQAYLIRTNQLSAQRQLDKILHVLAAAVAITMIRFAHFQLSYIPVQLLSDAAYYSLSLTLNAVVVFVVIYGLAIRNRDDTALYGRYLLSTVFPFVTLLTDPLSGAYLPALGELVPQIGGMPVLPVAGFVLADVILLSLIVRDWRARRQLKAFPIALGLLVAYQVSALTFYTLPAWRIFCTAFMHLPIS
jgi:hypothetical protein